MRGLWKWIEERSGWLDIRRTLLDRKIPKAGRWGWLYTLGSATLVAFLIQVVTGMLLGMNYSPSPDHAYESIQHIMTSVPLGSFIRGLHRWGASAMIVLVLLHMIRVFVMGSYKKPRELTWIFGVVLFLIVLGLGFTGYLLPWDQKAYWATAVGANIAEQAPFVGPWIAKVLKGGEELGALTLTRFYAFHVLVLPALLVLSLAIHLFFVVYHGISAPPHRKNEPAPDYYKLKEEGKSFYPYSVFKDLVVGLLVIAVVFFLAVYFGAELEDPANPSDSSYNPRPEWYFMFLFQMLKIFPGSLETIAAIVLPTILLLILVLVPFLDRGEKRHPFARPIWMGGGFLTLGIIVWFTYQGAVSPLLNPRIERDPLVLKGQQVYSSLRCSYCHQLRGEGGNSGPDLTRTISVRSDTWLDEHFRKPRVVTPGSQMPELNLLDEEIHALIAYLRDVGGGGASVTQALKLFEENCNVCHRLHEKGGDVGPDLTQVGNFRETTWIHAYTKNPQSLNPDSSMPEFGSSLSEEEIEILARYLTAQKGP